MTYRLRIDSAQGQREITYDSRNAALRHFRQVAGNPQYGHVTLEKREERRMGYLSPWATIASAYAAPAQVGEAVPYTGAYSPPPTAAAAHQPPHRRPVQDGPHDAQMRPWYDPNYGGENVLNTAGQTQVEHPTRTGAWLRADEPDEPNF